MAKKIIRFYDDSYKLKNNRPLYLIAENDDFGLEYYELNKANSRSSEGQFSFDKYVFNGEGWLKPDTVSVIGPDGVYKGKTNYIVAFDVLWDGLNEDVVEILAKDILIQPQVIGVIVYTTMGSLEEAAGRIRDLRSWLGDIGNKVNERYVKIGSTDPYSGVLRLKKLAIRILEDVAQNN